MSIRQAELVVALRNAIGEGDGERSGGHVRELLGARRESLPTQRFYTWASQDRTDNILAALIDYQSLFLQVFLRSLQL